MTRTEHVIEATVGASTGRSFPALGLTFPRRLQPLTERETDLLIGLRLAHFRVDLDLTSPRWRRTLIRAAGTGLETATALELAVRPGPAVRAGLDELAQELTLAQVGIARLILDPADGTSGRALADEARSALRSAAPKAEFVLASHSPVTGAGEALGFGQLRAHGWASALRREAFMKTQSEDARELVASPVFAPPIARLGRTAAGAVSTVSSLSALARAGATSITYEAPAGWGVIQSRKAGRLVVTDTYHVLADLGECDFKQLGHSDCSKDNAVVLCIYSVDGVRVIAANLTRRARRLRIGPFVGTTRLLTLDAETLAEATNDPDRFRRRAVTRRSTQGTLTIDLGPYAIARIDA
jgi:hypothetical protein